MRSGTASPLVWKSHANTRSHAPMCRVPDDCKSTRRPNCVRYHASEKCTTNAGRIRAERAAGGLNDCPKNTCQIAPTRHIRRWARAATMLNKCLTITAKGDFWVCCAHWQGYVAQIWASWASVGSNAGSVGRQFRQNLAEHGPIFADLGQIRPRCRCLCMQRTLEITLGGNFRS